MNAVPVEGSLVERLPELRRQWIFVTGAPRSATTFVGRMLSLPWSVDYVHEPFNPMCGMPGIEAPYLYLRPGMPDQPGLKTLLDQLYRFDFSLRTGHYQNDTPLRRAVKRVIGSRGPFYLRLAKRNPLQRSVVLKDPSGCLLTEYLAMQYGMQPVVLIRHPLAFVASAMRLHWPVSLAPLLAQPAVLAELPQPCVEAMRDPELRSYERAAHLWCALNRLLFAQVARHPDWILLRHEDLGAAPVPAFRELYARLALPWSARIERRIARLTASGNPVEARGRRVQDFSRASDKLFGLRKGMLAARQRERIFEITGEVAQRHYPAASFYDQGPGG